MTLRPIVVHQGTPTRHEQGYSRKTDFIALSWKPTFVEYSIAAVTDANGRAQLVAARVWLLEYSLPYLAFTEAYNHALTSGKILRLEPTTILEPYKGCALFPKLYWCKDLAENRFWDKNWSRPFANQGRKHTGRMSVNGGHRKTDLLCRRLQFQLVFIRIATIRLEPSYIFCG